MPDEPPQNDLPQRTWRQWWQQTPSGFRIGVWGIATLAGFHLVLAIRIAVGLIEPAEVRWLRQRNTTIYFSTRHWNPVLDYVPSIVGEGLIGRSCRNVCYIGPANATDSHLNHIGAHFPNVQQLCLNHAEITSLGITSLFACRHLTILQLPRSTVDDDCVKQIARFEKISYLDLSGTLITDAAIPYLQDMKSLMHLDVSHTRISLEAIQSWRSLRRPSPFFRIDTEKDAIPDELFSFIRWSDGKCSASFGDPIGFTIDFKGPQSAERWDCNELDGGQFNHKQPSRDRSWDYYK